MHNVLLEYSIAKHQEAPSNLTSTSPDSDNNSGDFLDPKGPNLPTEVQDIGAPSKQSTISFMGPLSGMTDGDLDDLILHLYSHYQHAEINMLNGMLWHLGHRLPHEHICGSLMRVDPMHHVFQRIQIQRRVYSVPRPMLLWHHDGQHSLYLLQMITIMVKLS